MYSNQMVIIFDIIIIKNDARNEFRITTTERIKYNRKISFVFCLISTTALFLKITDATLVEKDTEADESIAQATVKITVGRTNESVLKTKPFMPYKLQIVAEVCPTT